MHTQQQDMIFNTAGGRMPFSVLRRAAEIAMVHGNGQVQLGSRQELILCRIVPESQDRIRRELGSFLNEHHPRHPNIVTTRPVAGRARRTPWLSDGAYDAVLSQFATPPALPVNLSDPQQAYVPLFTGQINFLATPEPGFWRIVFNTRGQLRPTVLSTVVHNEGVPAATFALQQFMFRDGAHDLPGLQRTLDACLAGLKRECDPKPLPGLDDARPITGFVVDAGSDTYTLGISARSQPLPAQFLLELSLAAQGQSIATAGFTPWQSLLIHGIPRSGRAAFERLLLRHRVSAGAGGWESVCFFDTSTPQVREAAQTLLRMLTKTYPHPGALRIGLSEHDLIIPDTPIVIRTETTPARWPFRRKPLYSVYMREDFGRLNPMLIPRAVRIPAERLGDAVLEVIERCGSGEFAPEPPVTTRPIRTNELIHQCLECRTEYSELYGDPLGGVDAGTPFAELPATWSCPTCGAPQSKYITTRGHAA